MEMNKVHLWVHEVVVKLESLLVQLMVNYLDNLLVMLVVQLVVLMDWKMEELSVQNLVHYLVVHLETVLDFVMEHLWALHLEKLKEHWTEVMIDQTALLLD